MDINYSIPVTLFDYQEREDGLYSLAKLKIFYIGQTQDRRLFTREFSEQLIKTLPYVPVVGFYDEEEEDFKGHNEAVQHIYGVVPEDTSIEYVKEAGKEYVVCDVILYTGRLDQTGEIAKKIVGKPHSLELNPNDTTYTINKNSLGKIENIEFKTGSLLGLSILGEKEEPAFMGSSFFKKQENIISKELRHSMNEFYRQELQQCKFELNQQRFIRDSYENRRERAYEALKEMYLDVEFDIKEMNDMFIVYKEYYEDQNGKRYNYNQIQYKDNGYEVELIGGPIKVYKMYLTAEEIDMLSEPAESLDYRTLEDLDLKPTEAMANAAKRGLDLRSEYGRGGTSVGIARARDLSNRKNLSPDTVRRMYSFFSRHEVNKGKDGWKVGDDKYPSNGLIAWLLWGGDPGYTWAESKWNQIKKIRENQLMSLTHENVEVKNVSGIDQTSNSEDVKMVEAQPAPPSEQIEGSDENKPGSAAGPGADIKISKTTEKALQNKVDQHNEKMKEEGKPNYTRTTLAQLKSVYRRGAGAYSSSHRPGVSRAAWAMARVNAYLYLLEKGKPKNKAYNTDNDLLPKGHPKSTRNSKAKLMDYVEEKETNYYPKDEDMIEEEEKMVEEKEMVEEEEKMVEEEEEMIEEEEKMVEEEDMEYPKDKEDMAEVPEEVEAIMDIISKYPEIIKEVIDEMMPDSEDEDMEEHGDEKEDMEYPKDKEDMEYPKDKEDMGTEYNSTEASSVDEDDVLHGEKEEEITAQEAEEDFNSSALNNSEREELEAFRKERKESLIVSFEEDLDSKFIEKLRNKVNDYTYEELDVVLSKEFTRINRVEKKQKPDAFIYNNKTSASKPKSEEDLVRNLVEKYK